MTENDKIELNGIRLSIIELKEQFDEVGTLEMRSSEKLVEAKASIIRAGRKINKILDEVDD